MVGFVTHKTNVYGNIWIIKKKKRDVEYIKMEDNWREHGIIMVCIAIEDYRNS